MRLSILLAIVLLSGAPLAQAPSPAPSELAARIQTHYATVRDFTADFALTQKSSLRPKPTEDRGVLKVKKPLKMRWTFTTNDRSEFIADGIKLYSVFPRDKYASVSSLPKDNESGTWLLFLTGRGDLTKDFSATMPAEQPPSEWRLMLKPSTGRIADLRLLTLDVDRATYQLRGMTVLDEQGGTSVYRFSNLRENRNLNDREFVFSNPKGLALRYE